MEKLRVSDTLRQKCEGIRILEFHDAIKPDLKNADAHLRVMETNADVFLYEVDHLARSPKKRGKNLE